MRLPYYFSLLTEILVPRRCSVCGEEIHTGYFCPVCRENFLLEKMQELAGEINVLYLLFRYQSQLREAIHEIKFRGGGRLIPHLREEVQMFLTGGWGDFLRQYDIIDTIPTSADRVAERHYDVPREIFAFLPLSKVPILRRVRRTAPLFSLNQEGRERELAGCFQVTQGVSGKRILLLDDIYTTGSTAREAARSLKQAGAAYVDFLGFTAGKNNWD